MPVQRCTAHHTPYIKISASWCQSTPETVELKASDELCACSHAYRAACCVPQGMRHSLVLCPPLSAANHGMDASLSQLPARATNRVKTGLLRHSVTRHCSYTATREAQATHSAALHAQCAGCLLQPCQPRHRLRSGSLQPAGISLLTLRRACVLLAVPLLALLLLHAA